MAILENKTARRLVSAALAPFVMSLVFFAAASASAQNYQNADAVYNRWLSTYLVKSGGNTYFTDSMNERSLPFMWGQAYDTAAVEDACDRTRSANRKQLTSDLLNTCIEKNLTDLAWNSWNNDVAWAAIALIRGYYVTGTRTFLDADVRAWYMAYGRGWDNKYGGGIWEDMSDKDLVSGNKGVLSNWTFVIAGAAIYQATGDASYLNRSKQICAWACINAFDATTGRVYEDIEKRPGAGSVGMA